MGRLWVHSLWIIAAMFAALFALSIVMLDRLPVGRQNALPIMVGFVLFWVGLQFLIAPKLIDWLVRFRKGAPEDVDEEFGVWMRSTCAELRLPMPRFAVLDDGAPNAFTYGHVPRNARVAVTRALVDTIDRGELKTVVAHELGHVKHWDFVLMTVVQALVLLFYVVFRTCVRNLNKDRIVVAIVAFVVYMISEYVALWFSRVREYMADKFAAKTCRNPAALASALIKITYGLAQVKATEMRREREKAKNKDSETLEPLPDFRCGGVRGLGIAPLGVGSAVAYLNPNGELDPAQVARAAKWEVTNPWAKLMQISSTHPLTSQRVEALRESAEEIGQHFPFERPVKGTTNWRRFWADVAISFAPLWMTGLAALLALPMLPSRGAPYGALVLLVFFLAFIIKLGFSYKIGQPRRATIEELIDDTDVSHVNSVRVELRGEFTDLASPVIWAHDYVLQDETGFLPCYIKTMTGIPGLMFGMSEAPDYVGQKVVATGWYRRMGTPHLELEKFALLEGGITRDFVYRGGWLPILFVLAMGCAVALAATLAT